MKLHAPPRRPPARSRRRCHRGVALLDVMIGGAMLGIGLSVVLSITSRSLSMQTDGEARLVATWLADELLSMVLVEGPDNYPLRYDPNGRFEKPFEQFRFDVDVEHLGRGAPYRVSATVRWTDRADDYVLVETLIALRQEEDDEVREPLERIDRDERWHGDDEQ